MRVFYVSGTAPPLAIQRRERLRRRAGLLAAAAEGPSYTGPAMVVCFAAGVLPLSAALLGLTIMATGIATASAGAVILHRLERELTP